MSNTMLLAALAHASRGWHVFPLKPKSKEPATWRGFYDATTNPATLRRWFASGFAYNIAIRTGTPSNVFVIDVDGDQGVASLQHIEAKHGPLPPTLISITGKGKHYWFITIWPIPCSTAKLGAGIDVKADQGYVVAPASVHPNGKKYQWLDAAIPLAPAPEWLVQLARAPKPLPISERAIALIRPPTGQPGAYGRAALNRECAALAAMLPDTGRNCALNIAALRLGQLVAGGELTRDEVFHGLLDASIRNQLVANTGRRAVLATINSGFNTGLKSPRSRQGRHD
jgi:hypothetical protein